MSQKTAAFEAVCPHCGEKVKVVAESGHVAGDQARVPATCQRCLNPFEAAAELDCLEWDDACTSEIGRLA
jgi:hypothetical protein